MAKQIEQLTDLKLRQLRAPGRHADGQGLYVQVTASKMVSGQFNRSWIVRVRVPVLADDEVRTQVREIGLGRYPAVGLAEARSKAAAARSIADAGDDPLRVQQDRIRAKLEEERAVAAMVARTMTFAQCADAYIDAHQAQWRNDKHIQQWRSSLKNYVYPVFGNLAIGDVDVALVTKVLDPIWTKKAETARRVRGRIEAVLDWATVRGHRIGDNPARWKGHLQKALPQRSKVKPVEHHSALAFDDIAVFMSDLRGQSGIAALALEFTILTAARTGEVIGARWSEIDQAKRVWTIPPTRMKGGKEHRVPLSAGAMEALKRLPREDEPKKDWLFTLDGEKPLSNMAMLMMLRRMKRDDLTVHGFRSTFRDWGAERTGFPPEVVEAALAHVVGSKVEAAYRRGDLFEKRRRLMQAWADNCLPHSRVQVVQLASSTRE